MEHSTASMQSPLVISHEDMATLSRSQAFCALRSHLAANVDFCTSHTLCDQATKDTFLSHRDILHALIMPIVALFLRSSALASAALCSSNREDLELAFSGDARSAFLCLQCFISEEKDWCQTNGCPACVVTATLSTESHIRLTVAASLLSMTSLDGASDRQLPPLSHMLPTLRTALTADAFWKGSDVWPYLLSRATQLSTGIQALITACFDLESLVSSPQSEQPLQFQKRSATHSDVPFLGSGQVAHEKGVRLRKSKLAKRQLRLKEEEIQLMRRVAFQCWAKLQFPKQIRGEILGVSKSKRARSLTCP